MSACNFLSFVRTRPKLFVIFWKFLSEAKLKASGEENERNKMSTFGMMNKVQARVKFYYKAFALNKVRFALENIKQI